MDRSTRAMLRAFVVLVFSWPIVLVATYYGLSIAVRSGLIKPFLIAQIVASAGSLALALLEFRCDLHRDE